MIRLNKLDKKALDNLVERPTDVYTIKSLQADAIRPERLRLKLADDVKITPLDFGALCFAKRERMYCDARAKNTIIGRADRVELDSLRTERKQVILQLIDEMIVHSLRDNSIDAKFLNISTIFDWCDLNGFSDFLVSKEHAKSALFSFIDALFNCVHTGTCKPYTLLPLQHMILTVIELRYGKPCQLEISQGLTLLKAAPPNNAAPRKIDVANYLDVVKNLSVCLSDALVLEKPFPFILTFTDYAAYRFPIHQRGVKTPYTKNEIAAYNFDEGRLKTEEEYLSDYSGKRSQGRDNLAGARAHLERCNTEFRCGARMGCAATALKAWACVFWVVTGANEDVLRNIEHDSSLEIVKSPYKRSLDSIKFRANGKHVRLPIGRKEGFSLLKKYLRFRDWVLNGQKCKWLFFVMTGQHSSKIRTFKQIPRGLQSRFFKITLAGTYLPQNAENITTTMSRKYKSVVLHELQVNPTTVAHVMGHSATTNMRSYALSNTEQMESELSSYWTAVHRAAEKIKTQDIGQFSSDNATVTGHCQQFGQPQAATEKPAIAPDCNKQMGCLFCEHYICHADETDIHKLLSFRYVLEQIIKQSEDIKHAGMLFTELIDRIDVICDAIRSSSSVNHRLVIDINERVNSLGILTAFWEKRLQRFESMGILL